MATHELIRKKNPEFDLKRTYHKVLRFSTIGSIVLHLGVVIAFPSFQSDARKPKTKDIIIETVDIPETRQIQRPPPPPRPAMPIETENDDVPDDVTIASTDLDLEDVDFDIPPHPSNEEPIAEEEEILEFFMVEQKPEIVKQVPPEYPEVARKAGIQGAVIVKVLIGTQGQVEEATVLRGKEILQRAALEAIYQYQFSPAKQNDKPVKVWLTMPIRFQLIS